MDSLIKKSEVEKIKIDLIYLNREGEISQRTIRVTGVRRNHVLAYCYTRKEVRSFLKENILAVFPVYRTKKSFGA
ncbi:hypothetical protein [Halobacillus karajensis]|uniref:hypothetical protein n=1 Tax=Halobacillus karajensis TaxID=195088 RepID=UPI0005557BA8|nr:hypothetical protein [Halobacillus karajensis]